MKREGRIREELSSSAVSAIVLNETVLKFPLWSRHIKAAFLLPCMNTLWIIMPNIEKLAFFKYAGVLFYRF